MKLFFSFLILIALHLFFLTKLQFTAWPEMFSYPYLLNNDFKLYQDIALPYQPFLMLILSNIYKIFGVNLLTLQVFTWTLIILSDLLIFLISLKVIGKKYLAILPLFLYVFIQPLTDGNMLWFDLATVPFILLSIVSLLYINGLKKFFTMGLFLSGAFFMKQQTGVVVLFLMVYLLFKKQFKELIYMFLGILLPALFVLLYIIITDTILDYIFWSITVPIVWYPQFPGYSRFPSTRDLIILSLILIPGVLWILKSFKRTPINIGIIFALFFGAFIISFPRFEYFRFQPALALYFVLLAYVLEKVDFKKRILITIPAILAILLLMETYLKFNLPVRFYGEKDLKLTQKITEITEPTDRIYILGESSALYVLSNRLPPNPWVDNYVWYMEIDGIQEKVIEGLINTPPKIILRKNPQDGNWFDLGTYQPKKVVDFIEYYYQKDSTLGDLEIWTKKD